VSYQAVKWVLDHSETKGSDRLAMVSIAEHADANGRNAHPSIGTIAREAAVSHRQAERAVAKKGRPCKLGELRVERQLVPIQVQLADGTTRTYRVHRYSLPKMAQPEVTARQDDVPSYGVHDPTSTPHDPTSRSGKPSLEPSEEPPSFAPALPTREEVVDGEVVDDIMNALEEVFGRAPLDKRLRGQWVTARKQLEEQGATAAEIQELAPVIRRLPKHGWMAVTPLALAKHWGQIASGKVWELVDWRDQAVVAASAYDSSTSPDSSPEAPLGQRSQEHRAGVHDLGSFSDCPDCSEQEATHVS
jgi:hypothetical protein